MKDKFIGFADILGFKSLLASAEAGTGMSSQQLQQLVDKLGSVEDRQEILRNGPTICPGSLYIKRDLDFELTRLSDCVVVSAEISPAGIIHVMNHCLKVAIRLMRDGIMCRGYITRGMIHHIDEEYRGPGLDTVVSKEKEAITFRRQADESGTPFIEIDPFVCDYVQECEDSCVKEMFRRFTRDEGHVTALFPFDRLGHSFIIGISDPEKERRNIATVRQGVITLKERVNALVDKSNPSAVQKGEHYIRALNEQLEVCNRTDEMLDMLASSFPSHDLGSLNGY